MMELPVTVMGERMHTMETARTTETGLMSSRVSILVTVGMSVVVNSPAKVVDGNGVSVANVDIVAHTVMEKFAFILDCAVSSGSSFSHRRRTLLRVMAPSLSDYHVTARSIV